MMDLKLLWPMGRNDEKVLLMISDAAPYIVKTGQSLAVFYPNLIYVICVAHNAHMFNRGLIGLQKGLEKYTQTLIN